jgi:nitroreductase
VEVIRSRRVTRTFTAEPVDEPAHGAGGCAVGLERRQPPHRPFPGGPRHRAIVQVRAFSPGMLGVLAALVVICTDVERVRVEQVQVERDTSVWMDVGTAAMSMMLAAHALGLGSCPTTSFSLSGVAEALNLPSRAALS